MSHRGRPRSPQRMQTPPWQLLGPWSAQPSPGQQASSSPPQTALSIGTQNPASAVKPRTHTAVGGTASDGAVCRNPSGHTGSPERPQESSVHRPFTMTASWKVHGRSVDGGVVLHGAKPGAPQATQTPSVHSSSAAPGNVGPLRRQRSRGQHAAPSTPQASTHVPDASGSWDGGHGCGAPGWRRLREANAAGSSSRHVATVYMYRICTARSPDRHIAM